MAFEESGDRAEHEQAPVTILVQEVVRGGPIDTQTAEKIAKMDWRGLEKID